MPSSLLQRAIEARYRGALDEARALCTTILEEAPRDAHALSLMAAIAADEQRLDDGMRWAQDAMSADPALAEPHYVMGRLRELAGRPAEAEASYRRAIELDPRDARAHNNLGCILRIQNRAGEALACFRRALEIDPGQAEASQNIAAMTNDARLQERAIEGYRRQIAADPTDARAFANLANIYLGRGQWPDAAAALERALALEPQRAETHYAKALFLLLSGDYRAGWREYQWRWKLGNWLGDPARRFRQPIWDGGAVDGPVFLHGEPPFGDTIQFGRYAPLVAARCRGGVILECARELQGLMRQVAGVSQVVDVGAPPPSFAAHAPLMALPSVFDTTLETVPWSGPYLHADPARAAAWRDALHGEQGRMKVGLVWTGNPINPNNLDRSVPPEKLARLTASAGISFFSLQKGAAGERAAKDLRLIDLTERLLDFSDTAALLGQLDLVISVDTAVAHLAGAMGRPVWVMLNCVPDWRYHLERRDNPWYPSMRLYRQAKEGDWDNVLAAVAADLASGMK